MAYFIIFVLVVIVIIQQLNIKSLVATVESESPVLTRYIQACRWVAGVRIQALDIDLFAHQRKSDSMLAWEKVTGKNSLIVDHFRDYVNHNNSFSNLNSDQSTFVINHCLYLINRMNISDSFYDVMHFTESYERIVAMLFWAGGLADELDEIQESATKYSDPKYLIAKFYELRNQAELKVV